MIFEYTKVKTLVSKDNFPAGSIGIVVSFYKNGKACEVEIWDKINYPVDVVTYSTDELVEIS